MHRQRKKEREAEETKIRASSRYAAGRKKMRGKEVEPSKDEMSN